MCWMYNEILIASCWTGNSTRGKHLFESIVVSSPPEGTVSPSWKKTAFRFFFFISLDFGIYWIGDWKSYSLYLMWGFFLDFLWTRALFSAIITPFYISNKNCSLCSLNRCIFLICSSFHMPILLQEWSLFWKGTVTSFCKICITNFSEVLPLPKPQKYQMACSTCCSSFPVTWMDVLNNTLFVTVLEIGSFFKFSFLYVQSACSYHF